MPLSDFYKIRLRHQVCTLHDVIAVALKMWAYSP